MTPAAGPTPARARGTHFEQCAEALLRDGGLTVVARNYSCRGGEIDLIMNDAAMLVFVEVRYRRSGRFGSAAESVDRRKQMRIVHAARHFLARNKRYAARPCRFDVVAMSGAEPAVHADWIKGAFSA